MNQPIVEPCISDVERWKAGRLVSRRSCGRRARFEVWTPDRFLFVNGRTINMSMRLGYCARHVSHVGNPEFTSARREDVRRIA